MRIGGWPSGRGWLAVPTPKEEEQSERARERQAWKLLESLHGCGISGMVFRLCLNLWSKFYIVLSRYACEKCVQHFLGSIVLLFVCHHRRTCLTVRHLMQQFYAVYLYSHRHGMRQSVTTSQTVSVSPSRPRLRVESKLQIRTEQSMQKDFNAMLIQEQKRRRPKVLPSTCPCITGFVVCIRGQTDVPYPRNACSLAGVPGCDS